MSDAIPYEVVSRGGARPPRLPGTVVVRDERDDIIDALLADLFIHSKNCVRTFGDFQLAVSATPQSEPFLQRLLYDLNYRDFPWGRTRLWLVDEVVTGEPDSSRFATLRDNIVDQSGIPQDQVHKMTVESPVAAEEYAAELRQHLGWREKGHDRLDFVLLSLGAGGEVAGHAPGATAAGGPSDLVVRIPAEGTAQRVAMSLEFINASRIIAVIAAGQAARAEVGRIARAFADGAGPEPALTLRPLAGDLRWYLDAAACAEGGA
jgi:6-phosphogluconolactonase/glucosamine-6-phosphate isomerase/deaminase